MRLVSMLRTAFLGALLSLFAACLSAGASEAAPECIKLGSTDLYLPAGTAAAKAPLLILAHNGGAQKEDWGDFPVELASKGYVVANIGWTDFAGHADFASAIQAVLEKAGQRIDVARIAAIGGCHGGVKFTDLIKAANPAYPIKAAVFLSVSEKINLPEPHLPILGFYATQDRLGDYYQKFTKDLLENQISQPKKVVAFNGTPHGNEMTVAKESRDSVRREIIDWLATSL